MSKTGTLSGLADLPRRNLTEFRPYLAASADLRRLEYGPTGSDSLVALADQRVKVGGDAKLAVAPTLTLDLTANTDFAQVEADRQVST